MSPKNAIKMINIQKSYLVHVGPILSNLSSLIHFSSITSTFVLVGPHWSYFVHFSPISFTLVMFGPFCPSWSYLVDIVTIRSITSTLVLIYPFVLIRSAFGPLYPIWSTLFPFSSILSIQSTSFHSVQFGPSISTLVQFGTFYLLF